MFAGYADLDGTFTDLMVTAPPAAAPAAPDAAPTWQVYGPAGAMPNGTGTCAKFAADPGLYSYAIPALGSAGYEVAGSYLVVFRYSIGGVALIDHQSFLVT